MCCFIAVRGDITQVPKNVATKVRQRLTLPCAGNSTMEWSMMVIGSNHEQVIIYNGKPLDKFKDSFSVNTDGGQFALVIKSTVLSDGKTYRCKDVAQANYHHGDAEVIVFGKTYFYMFYRPVSNSLM